ncbi:MAG: WD40 repeat domain-containing protein [Planctomycetes bacterium]|nr:WD40 repeat domain-containing protein [Planctomycetota bacterium]
MIVLHCAEQAVERLHFTPDGRGLVVPQAGKLQRWDDVTAGGPPVLEIVRQDKAFAQATADGCSIVFGGLRPCVRDVASGRTTALQFREPFPFGAMLAATPDSRHLVAAQWSWNSTPRGRLTCRAMTNLGADVWSVDVDRRFQDPPLFLPGGDRFVMIEWWVGVGTEYGPIFVTRDTNTGETVADVRRSYRDRDRVYEFPVISADRRLLAARSGARVAVYRTDDFALQPAAVKNNNRKHFTGVAFHPSGRYLAATSNDETVKLYDTTTWEVARTFTWDIGRMRSVAFSPDGTLAAAGSDTGKVVVWDVDV